MMHTKKDIDDFLRNAFFGVLTFPTSEGLVSQLMIFAHAPDGVFYLVSQNKKEFFLPLSDQPEVSLLIYKEEEDLNRIQQVNVVGKAILMEGFDREEVKEAYEVLGEKSPFIKNVPFDEEHRQEYSLAKVEAEKITYITFGEIKQQISPTILKRI